MYLRQPPVLSRNDNCQIIIFINLTIIKIYIKLFADHHSMFWPRHLSIHKHSTNAHTAKFLRALTLRLSTTTSVTVTVHSFGNCVTEALRQNVFANEGASIRVNLRWRKIQVNARRTIAASVNLVAPEDAYVVLWDVVLLALLAPQDIHADLVCPDDGKRDSPILDVPCNLCVRIVPVVLTGAGMDGIRWQQYNTFFKTK